MAKITLDAKTFQALASSTRLTVLRALDERRKTLTELARDMELNKATVHEHLQLLTAAGLVKKRDDEGRKWIYYELTWTGEKLLHPQETTTFNVLLGLSVAAAGGGVGMLGRALGWWFANNEMAAPSESAFPTSGADTEASQPQVAQSTRSGSGSAPPEGGSGAGAPAPAETPAHDQAQADALRDQDANGAKGTTAPTHEHDFFGDGGWLGLALLLAAIAFTALAVALRRHLAPGRFVPPEGVAGVEDRADGPAKPPKA